MTDEIQNAANGRLQGSFRDPSGYVFEREGRIFRAINSDCAQVLRRLFAERLLDRLVSEGSIVKTEFVEDDMLREALMAEHPGYESFLEHDVVTTISYPYEWSFSMLANAAIHTLDLQLKLASSGFALKDATAYNIQFVQGKPLFIDVSSIERPKRQDIWFALGQFSQMFTFPLLLCRYAGWNLRSYFQGNLGGLGPEELARTFGWLRRLHPQLLLDVTLPLWLHRWAERDTRRSRREILEQSKSDARAQILNLQRLKSKIGGLARSYRPRGIWSEYKRICNYDERSEQAKKSLVADFLRATRPSRLLDAGCNTGDYSQLAVACGADVIAVDADPDAIEVLYRQVHDQSVSLTPLVVDLCNPSPGIGFMNRERPPFLERVDADCVLALALTHHLLVTGNLPLSAICELLFTLTKRDLVLEFVPTDDSMFQQLMRFRVDLFDGLTLDVCRNVFLKRFRLLSEEPIPASKRTLLFLRKLQA